MELILTDEQQLLQDSAATFFSRLGGVKRTRSLRDSATGFDRAALRQTGENGWLGMLVAEEQGGAALGPRELALLMQQAGRLLAPEPFADVMLAALMLSQGDPAGRSRLDAVMSGDAVIVAAVQDAAGMIDAADASVTATRRDGGWLLNGRRSFVLGAAGCDGLVVGARDEAGPLIVHIPRTAAGLTITPVPTVDGRAYGELEFRDVAARDLVAHGDGAAAILARHQGLALIAAAAEMLGVMEGVNELTLDYLKTRKQFGRAIGSFQALQHRAVDNHVLIESTRSLLHQVCEAGEPIPPAMASAVKAVASGAGLTVTKSAVQLHGAIGFTEDYDAGLYLKRAMWLSAYLGNEMAHHARFARLS